MRFALAALAVVVGLACGLLLAEARLDAFAQGKGGSGKGGGGGGSAGGGSVSCTVDSATGVAFGIYDAESGVAQTSTGQLNFSCKPKGKSVSVRITISASTVTGSITDRGMHEAGGGDVLYYNLFQDQRGTIIWGDGATGGSELVVTAVDAFSVQIYGIAYPSQQVSEGVYADAVQISIQF